jgi:hypothetical protein
LATPSGTAAKLSTGVGSNLTVQVPRATRRAAAGDREEYPGLLQLPDGGDGAIGEDLVLGHQRAVHVGEEHSDSHVAASGLVR